MNTRQNDGPVRIAVAALALSAAAFIGLVMDEGYTSVAVIPTKGDVPTVGFGSTKHEDGTPVRMGDKTDPVRALVKAKAHIDREEQSFRDSLPGVKLTQGEYDLYVDFMYQFGIGNWRASSMRRHLIAGRYAAACDALLMWRKQGGRDCSLPQNWGPRGCKGVWTRQVERHAKCMGEQS